MRSAGAIAVGARSFLIAFNVILRSGDMAIARQIARKIRARNGGLPFVKALGFRLHTRDLVQVSMNLVNYEVTGMTAAYDAVHREADALGVEIQSAEIVGLVPRDALDREAAYFANSKTFQKRRSSSTRSISVHPCNPWLNSEFDNRVSQSWMLLHQPQIHHFFSARLCSNNSVQ